MRSVLVIIFFLIEVCVSAQTIVGRIHDEQGQVVVGATIEEQGVRNGTISDADGRYTLRLKNGLPTRLIVRCVGFAVDSVDADGQRVDIVLRAEDVMGEQVDIVGQKKGSGFEGVDVSLAGGAVAIDGGVEGLIKSQMGVSSNSELSSQYRVRGGNFDENIVYVNGIEIYRPFLIRAGEQEGLSFVNPDMVDEINFSAGGFDASYGDKMSSVLDVRYKRPQSTHWGARVSLLGASAHAEGATKSGVVSHITGVRYKTNQYLFGTLDTRGDYAPTFFDVQTYWTINPTEKMHVGLLAYYAANGYKFIPQDRETTFGTISEARKLTIYFEGKEKDRYRTCVTAADVSYVASDRLTLGLRGSMFRTVEEENYDILGEYWLQEAVASQSMSGADLSDNIGVGGYMQHARNDLFGEVYSGAVFADLTSNIGNIDAQAKLTTEHYSDYTDEWEYTDSAGYVASPSMGKLSMQSVRMAHNSLRQLRTEVHMLNRLPRIDLGEGKMQIDLGVRLSHLDTNSAVLISPRASVAYWTGNKRFRVSGGRYGQMPTLREMKRDEDATLNTQLKPQDSWQVIGGMDIYFGSEERPMKFTTEVYYKWLRSLNPYNIDNVRLRYMADNCAQGYAVGVDFKLNGELVRGVDSWATFSLMKTAEDVENDGHGYIPRPSDQRVQFSMVVQDYMPNNRSITAMLSMYFGSGLPFGPQGCERWQATNRMPGYKRVDLGLYKDFALNAEGENIRKHTRKAQFGIEVFNLFDFANTISYFWVRDTYGYHYAVPNYLTSRRINVKLTLEF